MSSDSAGGAVALAVALRPFSAPFDANGPQNFCVHPKLGLLESLAGSRDGMSLGYSPREMHCGSELLVIALHQTTAEVYRCTYCTYTSSCIPLVTFTRPLW